MSVTKDTWHLLRRSPFQSLSAIMVMTLSFCLSTFFAFLVLGTSSALDYFESRHEITIFLKDDITTQDLDSFRHELESHPGTRQLRYISKDDALAIYREQNKDTPLLLEMVTASILPASFELSAHSPENLDGIAQTLVGKESLVDEIVYQRDLVNETIKWSKTIRSAGLSIVSTVTLVSFFVLFVIIGMKITIKKQEISVIRLLGASRFYVKRPFLLEGIFYGIIGSFLGWLIASGLLYYFSPQINSFFGEIPFLPSGYSFYFSVLGAELLFASLLGFSSSLFAVRRHLKF